MPKNPVEQFEIPAEMRAFAEKSVEQAKQAFEGYLSAAHRAIGAIEGQAETARKGAKDVGAKAMDFAERNVATSFELAQKMVRAKNLQEIMELQSTFIRTQMQALAEQAKVLGEGATKAAADQAKMYGQS